MLNCQKRHSTTPARNSALSVDEMYVPHSAAPAGWSQRSPRDVLQDVYNRDPGEPHFQSHRDLNSNALVVQGGHDTLVVIVSAVVRPAPGSLTYYSTRPEPESQEEMQSRLSR